MERNKHLIVAVVKVQIVPRLKLIRISIRQMPKAVLVLTSLTGVRMEMEMEMEMEMAMVLRMEMEMEMEMAMVLRMEMGVEAEMAMEEFCQN